MLRSNMIQNTVGKAECLDPEGTSFRRKKKSKGILKKVTHTLKRREDRFWKKDQGM